MLGSGLISLRCIVCLVAFGSGAAPVAAQDRVIVSGRAEIAGDVAQVQAAWPDAVTLAPKDLGQAATARVVYFSGAISRQDGIALYDPAGDVPLDDVIGTDRQTVLLLNLCGTNMAVSAQDFALPGDWLIAFPAKGTNCRVEDFATAALGALDGPPQGWPAALRAAGLGVARSADHKPTSAEGLKPVAHDVIVISTAHSMQSAPRIVAEEVSARPNQIPLPETAALVDGAGDRGVQPLRAGLPRPSIIVGETAPPAPEVNSGPLGVPIAERDALRAADAANYARLLEGGVFDPEEARIAEAIQTELKRMACYPGTIDGVWGRGSDAALRRYFQKAGGQPGAAGAALTVYRQIIARADVTCDPIPVAVNPRPTTSAPTASSTTRRPSGGTAPRTPSSTGARAPAAPQPSAPARPNISPGFGGVGMFR